MLRHYINIALRRMAKDKVYTFINFAGLSAGIAVCFLLFLWIHDELSYDHFHEKSARIYRSLWDGRFGDNEWKIPQVPVPLAGHLEREYPEVEKATQAYEGKMTLKLGEGLVREKKVLFVDEDFFDVFTVKALAGDLRAMPANPDAILLTPPSAKRYFGAYGADYGALIGKTILRGDGKTLLVAGVVESFPAQSHLQFEFLASLKNLAHIAQRRDQWGSASCLTYFLARPGVDVSAIDAKMNAWIDKNPDFEQARMGDNHSRFPFEPITDIHLKPNLSQVWMFGAIGAFILLIACVNFINLATARALMRAKEVGVRKVLGSGRAPLIRQFFSESTLYVLASVILGLAVVWLILPAFNRFSGKELQVGVLGTPAVWAFIAGLTALTAVLTGVFPALALSSFAPVRVLKGVISGSPGGSRMRQGLVVFQFFISAALIMGTLVVRDQLQFIQNRALGFDKEQVVVLRGASGLAANYGSFLNWLRGQAGVERAASVLFMPGDGFDSTIFIPEQPSNYQETSLTYDFVDAEFIDALRLKLVAGRNFDPSIQSDSSAYILNQTAARRLGWDDPIGKKITDGNGAGQVIGVVEDFNFASLHDEIDPILLRLAYFPPSNIAVRLRAGDPAQTLRQIEAEWKKQAPATPFDYAFLDDQIQKQYEREQRLSKVFLLFSLLAVFIACLGLAGLAAFMALQRMKEIGVRKVLGASATEITRMLSFDFLKLVLVALLLAAPAAWWGMSKWLESFAYRTDIRGWVFAAAGVLTVAVAFGTVGFQSLKAALANPVKSLRSE